MVLDVDCFGDGDSGDGDGDEEAHIRQSHHYSRQCWSREFIATTQENGL